MVRAIVGANWGDEGKGKITDMLGEKVAAMLVIQSSTTTVNSHFIYYHQVCSTIIQQALSEMVLR